MACSIQIIPFHGTKDFLFTVYFWYNNQLCSDFLFCQYKRCLKMFLFCFMLNTSPSQYQAYSTNQANDGHRSALACLLQCNHMHDQGRKCREFSFPLRSRNKKVYILFIFYFWIQIVSFLCLSCSLAFIDAFCSLPSLFACV